MIDTTILIVIGVFVALILILLFLIRNWIDRKLHPQNWVKIEILEKDNNIIQKYKKKQRDLQFTFNDGTYNMFEVVPITDNEGNKTLQKQFTSIYREGIFTKLFYLEGNSNPLDFRGNKLTADAQQSKQIDKIQISRLLNIGGGLGEELWQKYGIFIALGILLVVLYLAFKK